VDGPTTSGTFPSPLSKVNSSAAVESTGLASPLEKKRKNAPSSFNQAQRRRRDLDGKNSIMTISSARYCRIPVTGIGTNQLYKEGTSLLSSLSHEPWGIVTPDTKAASRTTFASHERSKQENQKKRDLKSRNFSLSHRSIASRQPL